MATCDAPGCLEYLRAIFPADTSRTWYVDRFVLWPAGWRRDLGQVFCQHHS